MIPEVVTTDSKGMKSVSYGNMVGALIEAIKDLDAKNTKIQANADREASENAKLRAQTKKLRAEWAQIKTLLCRKFPDSGICTAKDEAELPDGWHPPLSLP